MNLARFREYIRSQEFDRKISHRLERIQLAEANPIERVNILIDCKDDFLTFVDLFGVVYEPRLSEMPDVPFFPFEYQRETALRMSEAERKGEDLFIEKTRDMGITWLVIWYILWSWLFKDRWYCLMGSRKEEEVDNKSPQSLFGKLRYAYYTLPQWIRPQKFKKSENDIFMKFINPDKNNFVDGESANPNFARGKRVSMCFMDELFFWKFARESWRSSVDTSPCRIAVSTATPTSFARQLSDSFKEQGKCITLNWDKHPFKDQEWFKKEEERRKADPLSMASEINISYMSDPELAYYPEVQNCLIRKVDYNPALPLYVGTDFGAKDKSALVYFQSDGQKFYVLDGIEKSARQLEWYYPFLKKGIDFDKQNMYEIENRFTRNKFTLRSMDYTQEEKEMIKKVNEWNPIVMYCGEVSDRQSKITSLTSIQQWLQGVGIVLRINDRGFEHKVRRTSTKKMLARTVFNDSVGALNVFDALANSTFPRGLGNSTSPDSQDKPVHNEFADTRSAVENFAVNIISEGSGIKVIPYRSFRR